MPPVYPTSRALRDYLSRVWQPGVYDCWSLVRDIYSDLFGVELPAVHGILADDTPAVLAAFKTSPILRLFEPSRTPVHGAVVGFSREGNLRHVGVLFDYPARHGLKSPRVLHLHRNGGAFEPLASITDYQLSYFSYARSLFS
jgi:hypothetical protein